MNWRTGHKSVMYAFLDEMNKRTSDYVLKGGTALMRCYFLDRFSEDIDLDSTNKCDIRKIVSDFCLKNGYEFRIAKETETVQRFMIHYSKETEPHPLKVEVSFRNREIDRDRVRTIDGITVYDINTLANMKARAYSQRDRIRDMYDLCYIVNKLWDYLNDESIFNIRESFGEKGFEQFDYLANNQEDELIDYDKLSGDFLDAWNAVGLFGDRDL